MTFRILILGGTSEARELANRLAGQRWLETTVSLAGRTKDPAAHAVPMRHGGFGGIKGLVRHLVENRIDLLIDATHPFARRISVNAAAAATRAGTEAFALVRPAWAPRPGDAWHVHADIASAVGALGPERRRVFAPLGRQELHPLTSAPHHFYLVRSVDPVDPPLPLPEVRYLIARGPFSEEAEVEMLESHRIQAIIAKNSGGDASYAKLAAARRLGVPVYMVARPEYRGLPAVETVDEAIARIRHRVPPDAWRGA